jgi:hypothetical protein
MKTIFVTMMLLIIAMIIIPIGGMCESNENHKLYMYSFGLCELLVVFALVRQLILIRKRK